MHLVVWWATWAMVLVPKKRVAVPSRPLELVMLTMVVFVMPVG